MNDEEETTTPTEAVEEEPVKESEPAEAVAVEEVKSEPALSDIVEILAKDFEVTPPEIEATLTQLINTEGFTLQGAVVKFRSDNKFQRAQTGREYIGRLIGKGGKRTQEIGGGRASPVCNLAWLVEEAGVPAILGATFWGDERVDLAQGLDFLKCYKFTAQKRADGSLTRSGGFTAIDDGSVMHVRELPKKGVEFGKLSEIQQYLDSSDLFYGYIGKLINASDTGEVIGFELGTIDAGPITVWCGGKFSVTPPDVQGIISGLNVGDEVAVYGYISQPSDKDIRINARGIIPL